MMDLERWSPQARETRSGLRALAAALLMGRMLAPGGARALEVDLVTVLAGPATVDGVLEGYFLEVQVERSGIAGVTLSVPGADLPLFDEGEGSWSREEDGFDRLADIRATAGFGTFTLVFTGTLGGTDEVDVSFDPGDDDPTGFPTITFPDDALLLDPAASSWGHPGSPILAGVTHEFNVAALRVFDLFEPKQTDLGDGFEYASACWSENSVVFTPEPGTGASSLAVLAARAVRHARRRPGAGARDARRSRATATSVSP